MSVAVCALTFHRPEGLEALLAGLHALVGVEPTVELTVVIIDNDPAASASVVVAPWQQRMRWPLTYAVEPRRGIPFGRNRAISMAGEVDFVAFVDDDEVPDPAWLAELMDVQRATKAAIVTGPVLATFETEPPTWAVRDNLFLRRRRPTGADIHFARTSNVLISRKVFLPYAAPFNEQMGLNGGDDTHFFMRAIMDGHRIVWADEAIVTERIPASRLNMRWLMQREYRRGNTLSLCLRDLRDSPVRRLRRAGQGVLRITEGVALLAGSVLLGASAIRRGVLRMCFGAGLLSGLVGVRFDEYRTVHGA